MKSTSAPQRQWKSACGHASPGTSKSDPSTSSGSSRVKSRDEGEHQRKNALGVGPQRQWKKEDEKPKEATASREEKKRSDAEARKKSRAMQARRSRIEDLETRIAATEQAIRDLEQAMAAPGFYDDRAAAQPIIDRHQSLMWEVGDLMHQWEALQSAADLATAADA